MAARMRADSTEYVTVTIVTSADVSGDACEVGLTTAKDMVPGAWITASHVAGNAFRFLVGPGVGHDVNPGAGKWFVVARLTDSPEVPVIDAGSFTVDAVTA